MTKQSKNKLTHLEVVANCVSIIKESLRNQSITVSSAVIAEDLSNLLSSYGNPNKTSITASTDSDNIRPCYNVAADYFSLAFDKYKSGDIEGSLKTAALAMEAEDCLDLVIAMQASNEEANANGFMDDALVDEAAVLEEGDDSDDDDDMSFIDIEDLDGDDSVELLSKDKSDDLEEDVEDLEDDEASRDKLLDTDDEDTSFDSKFESVTASSSSSIENIVLANMIALNGDPKARRIARSILEDTD